jgi:hypothetical protein
MLMIHGGVLNISSLPIELQLHLAIIRDESEPIEQEIRSLQDGSIDWDKFIQLAYQHRIYPIVASRIKSRTDIEFPTKVIKQLNQMYIHNTYKMLRLTASMEQLCKDLESHGVNALVLKGPVLAEALYGDFSLRTSKDIDLLVSGQDMDQAESIILQQGYKPDIETSIRLKSDYHKGHHFGYTHPDTGVQVELHWRTSSNMYSEPSFSELWQRRRATTKTSHPVYFLGHEDLFIYLVLHGARHGWFRIRWLTDIDRMIREGLDWDVVFEEFHKRDNMHVCGQTLLLCECMFRSPVENLLDQVCETDTRSIKIAQEALRIIPEFVNMVETKTTKEVSTYMKRYRKKIMSPQQRWKSLIVNLYPSSHDAQLLPLPRWLHFLYFPLRPFLWAWRKKKQQASA